MTSDDLRSRDRAARELAARSFDAPLLVEAGAGTGKTTTLIARIVAWTTGPGWEESEAALEGDRGSALRVAARTLERVFAITFTESAASEMARRLSAAYADLARGKDVAGLDGSTPDRSRAEALLASTDRIGISTIHAFCRRILAMHPLESGVHPELEVDADGTRVREVAREVFEEALEHVYARRDAGYLALAARGFGPREIEEALVQVLDAGVEPEALEGDPYAAERVAELVAEGRARLEGFRRLESGRLPKVPRGKKALELDDVLHQLARVLESADPSDFASLRSRVEELDTRVAIERFGDWSRGTFTKGEKQVFGPESEALARAGTSIRRWLRHLLAQDPALIGAARGVLLPLARDARLRLSRRGAATFDSLISDARRLLESRPDVARTMRRGISQLLVDEFQDTDAAQCAIVRSIALAGEVDERPGLFLVGDPKQSIYGWRSADLEAYDSFSRELREAGGRVATLYVNYRSIPEVLDEVECAIAPVMQERSGVQPPFRPLVPARERLPGDGSPAAVEYWVIWDQTPESDAPRVPSAAESARLEARAVACDLLDQRAAGTLYRDIGLLLRSRTHMHAYLQVLRDAGIPYVVAGDNKFFERREIVDAAALVRCVIDPADHLSLVTWLRSSAVGTPDAAWIPLWAAGFPDAMTELRGPRISHAARPLARTEEAVHRAFATLANAHDAGGVPPAPALTGWQDSLVAAVAALAALRDAFELDPPDVFVEKLRTYSLIEVAESARPLGAYRKANLERFFRRLAHDLSDPLAEPAAVLRAIRQSVEQARDEEEEIPRGATEDAVQILTIHQAKGLDFEQVYLLQAHATPGSRERHFVAEVGPSGGAVEYRLFGAATPGFLGVEEYGDLVTEAERVRTLYVALTRAKRRLVISGAWPLATRRGRADAYVDLLSQRSAGVPALREAFAATTTGASVAAHGAIWRFPDFASFELAPRGSSASAASPDATTELPGELVVDSRMAAARQARPLGESVTATLDRAAQGDAESRSEDAGGPAAAAPGSGGESTPPHVARGSGPTAELSRSAARALGTTFHGMLESLASSAQPRADLATHRDSLLAKLEQEVSPEEVAAARARAQVLFTSFSEGPLLARLESIHANVIARELPFIAPTSNSGDGGPIAYRTGVIDLMYRDPVDGAYVVVDYKTDQLDPGKGQVLRDRYGLQGRLYAEAVRSALGLDHTPRVELWAIETGEVVTVAPAQPAGGI